MAKMIIELDTEEKTMSVSIDGVMHENVNYVSINKYKNYAEEEEELHFCVEKVKKANDVMTREIVCASKQPVKTSIRNYLKALRG